MSGPTSYIACDDLPRRSSMCLVISASSDGETNLSAFRFGFSRGSHCPATLGFLLLYFSVLIICR